MVLNRYWSILLFLLFNECFGQTAEPTFNLVTGAGKIPIGKINGMTRDPRGVMWFTDQTNQCLVRYDGDLMTRFRHDPANPNTLGGTYPECIISDAKGILWIGFFGDGLDRFNPDSMKFTHFRRNAEEMNSLVSDSVSALLIDHLGNLWVGTAGGLDRIDPLTGKVKRFHKITGDSTSLSCDFVRVLYEDHQGNLWVGTGFPWDGDLNSGGLNRFDRTNETFTQYLHDPKNPNSLVNNKVRAIFEDSRGVFWVGTGGDGLHTMNRRKGIFERHSYDSHKTGQLSRPAVIGTDDHITFIKEDYFGNIWIGTYANGINRYNPVTKKMTHFGANRNNPGSFADNTGWWADISKDGLFWLSTQENNLYRVDVFSNNIAMTKTRGGVDGFLHDSESVLWLATDSGLFRKNPVTGNLEAFLHDPKNPNSLSNNAISQMIGSQDGNFWIGTWGGGMEEFNPKTFQFIHHRHNPRDAFSIYHDVIGSIYEDVDSNIWASTWRHGFDLMNRKTGRFTHFENDPKDSNSLSQNLVTSFLTDESKDIWVGTYSGGVNRLNRQSGKFKHYLQGLFITSIFKDKAGTVWLGSESGLFRYDRETDYFSSVSEKNSNLVINGIKSIVEDNAGNLWIGSSNGIYKLNKNRDLVITYSREAGIYGDLLYFGSMHKGPDGMLYFGGPAGYYSFFPEQLVISPNVPLIEFSNFWINGSPVKPGSSGPLREPINRCREIHLAYNQNAFSIGFSIVDYSNTLNKMLLYKLEGYDREWFPPGPESRANYYNLLPGKYTFRIKAVNTGNGLWQEKSIDLYISPPWFKRWWAYTLYILGVLSFIFVSNRLLRRRIIRMERERTRDRELAQAREIEKAYQELKLTQTQLIQSEKMASLGELTAGIAHEIQNPLNFVNNFSDVNTELIDEAVQALDSGDQNEAKKLLSGIHDNEVKIRFHGKRADAIVKGMLQHARTSSGQKEPTDFNALAEEYLRLSYQGLRARDKSFNATIHSEFDPEIGQLQINPQDMGRVLLNLYNNAFYAVAEKKKQLGEEFVPLVSVSTRKAGERVEIKILDNGNGIPQKLMGKIFQPFFTTKPTGQGTGLGLSLSYDIVKANGGEIRVDTQEGEGTGFTVSLPA